MPKRIHKIVLDSNKSAPLFEINKLDSLHLEVEVTEVETLENAEVELFFKKSDGILVSEIISEKEQNILKIDVKNGALDVPGIVVGQAKITEEDGNISSHMFKFNIKNSITSDDAIVNEIGIGAIEELKKQIDNAQVDPEVLKQKIEETINNGDLDVVSKEELKQVNSQLDTIKNNHLILNIKDFGATGEEDQDVTEILKIMLNSITTSSATIKFPLGIYNITSEITLPNKTLTFIGEGVEGTIIKNSTGNVMRSFFFKEATNNKRFNCFKDIQFNCNKKVNRAIYFERGNGTKITHCRFINHLEAGVWFEAIESMSGAIVYESEVIGNYFRGVEGALNNNKAAETMPLYNIYCGRGATDSIFKDNISVNAQTHMFINGGNNMIRDNHFFDYPVPQYNSKCHIHLNGTSSILGNYFDSPTCGIKVTGERFLISNNNFFWGVEEIDRTNFTGISLELTTERKRGVVITNNFFNPISSSVGYDIKVDCELELPMIINNRTMNTTNIYSSILQYSDSTTRTAIVNGNIDIYGAILPKGGSKNLGSSTNRFNVLYVDYGQKINTSKYTLTMFPEDIQTGYIDIMQYIQNLGNRVKALENK